MQRTAHRQIAGRDFLKNVQTDLMSAKGKSVQGTDIVQAQKALHFYEQIFFPKTQNITTLNKVAIQNNVAVK